VFHQVLWQEAKLATCGARGYSKSRESESESPNRHERTKRKLNAAKINAASAHDAAHSPF
jgi:hypothetical protein